MIEPPPIEALWLASFTIGDRRQRGAGRILAIGGP
jgi:hypothetical protein